MHRYIAIITTLLCVLIVCFSYIYANRIKIATNDKFITIYNVINEDVTVHSYAEARKVKPQQSTNNIKDDIKISLNIDRDKCDSKDYPLLLKVSNNSQDTLLSLTFNVDVREKNHSSSLVYPDRDVLFEKGTGVYFFDTILDPGYTGASCYSMPSFKKDLQDDKVVVAPFSIEYTFLNQPGGSEGIRHRFHK